MYLCKHIYIYIYTYWYDLTYVYICIHMCMHMCIYVYKYAYVGVCTHEYIHIYIHIIYVYVIYTYPLWAYKGQHAQLLSYTPSDNCPRELCKTKPACNCISFDVVFMITGSVDCYAYSPRVHYNTCSVIVTNTSLGIVAGTLCPWGCL